MTEILERHVSIPDAQGNRKKFIIEPTAADHKRAAITLSPEDRNARPQWKFPDER